MLSSDVPATPRPRPPAKMRRSSSLYVRPKPTNFDSTNPRQGGPPDNASDAPASNSRGRVSKRNSMSAAPSLPTLLGSPLSATSHVFQPHHDTGNVNEGLSTMIETEEWINEKSREELEELMQKAEFVIRERESELDIASAVCKSLRDSNTELMHKHDALVSRLPSLSSTSRPTSPTPSASTKTHSPPGSFHEHSLTWSPKFPKGVMRRQHHSRRVSTTPAELAFLSDQNAELQAKLQDLESDAARTEQAGRQRLRGLEREIQGLKEELDRTRAQSERLEAKMKVVGADTNLTGQGEVDVDLLKLWKRLNREAKVRELRAKTRPWENDGEGLLKDFAPASGLSKSTSERHPLRTSLSVSAFTRSKRDDLLPSPAMSDSSDLPTAEEPRETNDPPSQVPTPPRSPLASLTGTNARRERALVSQLLLKIRELEETNGILSNQHLEARMRLRRAEEETESMKKLYEMINADVGGGLELEMEMEVVEEDGIGNGVASGGAVTFDGAEMGLGLGLGLSGVGTPRRVRLRSVGKRSMSSLRQSFGRSMGAASFGADINSHSSLRRNPFSTINSVEIDPLVPEDDDAVTGGDKDTDTSSQLSDLFAGSSNIKKPRKPVKGLFDDFTSSDLTSRSESFKTAEEGDPVVFPKANDALTLEDLQPLPPASGAYSVTPRSDISAELPSLRHEDLCTSADVDVDADVQSPSRSDLELLPTLAAELASSINHPASPSAASSPHQMRTLGDELCGGGGVGVGGGLSPDWSMRSAGADHMRSRSIHDLLSKAEADGEGTPTLTPTPTGMNGGFASAQAQARAYIQTQIQAQTGHLSAPPHTPESHMGNLRKAKSTLSIRSPAQDSEGDRDEDVFHDAPEFGSGGSLRLRARTGTGTPQQQQVSPVIARANSNLNRIQSTPTPISSLRGVPIFSVDDLSLRRPGVSAMVHARRRVQSEASRKQPQQPPPKPRFIDLLNIWAWLQLLLSIAVIFVMAARLGPKAVVNNRRRASE